MDKKIIVSVVVLLLVGALGGYVMYSDRDKNADVGLKYETYFTYTDAELGRLNGATSKEVMAPESLYAWDNKMFELVSKNKLPDTTASRIYANVLAAQRDAAYLSFNEKGSFQGSFGPVSQAVLCIFFPKDCDNIAVSGDAYSQELAAVVTAKIKERKEAEDRSPQQYEIKTGGDYWSGAQPSIGVETKGWKLWYLASADQFRVSPPPHATETPELALELAAVKKALEEATSDQKQSVVFWAGGPGTKTPPGQWIQEADDYMRGKNASLEKAVLVRCMVAMSVADAVLAVFDSKYFYQVKRPFMRDSSIITIMPTPNHPSYPAGHATLSAAAATTLSFYYPENIQKWEADMYEAGNGRTWGGIHFPIDNEKGFELGVNVAHEMFSHLR